MRKLVAVPVLAVAIALIGLGVSSSLAATKAVKATKDNRWSPAKLTVKAGDKVRFTWKNTGAPHNVSKASGKGGSLTKNSVSNTGSATFTVPSKAKKGAKYRLICDVHAKTMIFNATVR